MKENKLVYKFDATKETRFGVLPRCAVQRMSCKSGSLSFQVASSSIMVCLLTEAGIKINPK